MAEQPTVYQEGQTATNPKTGQRVVYRKGMWVSDTASPARAETTADDRKALNEANERARIERDVQRTYNGAEQAVKDFDTGPARSWWMDAITNDEDDGIIGTIGANTIGLLARPFVADKTFQARDQLKTVNARTSLAASAQLKGVASDRDMGLLRLTGLKDSKTPEENQRIINEARFNSALEQYRARQKARWVTTYGSLSAPSRQGKSFEEISQLGEQVFTKEYQRLLSLPPEERKKAVQKTLPKAPPAAASKPVTIDINGNPL